MHERDSFQEIYSYIRVILHATEAYLKGKLFLASPMSTFHSALEVEKLSIESTCFLSRDISSFFKNYCHIDSIVHFYGGEGYMCTLKMHHCTVEGIIVFFILNCFTFALTYRHQRESDELRRRHQMEADAFLQKRGLNMSNLIMPSTTPVASPYFGLHMDTLSSFPLPSATGPNQQVDNLPGSPKTTHESTDQVINQAAEKPRKLFPEEMLKYTDLSRQLQSHPKAEQKKSLIELKLDRSIPGWDLSSDIHEHAGEMGSNASSRKSSVDLTGSQSSIPDVVRQHQQLQSAAGGTGIHQVHSQPHLSTHTHQPISQLNAVLGSHAFPPYLYGFHGLYPNFPGTGSHGHQLPFPLLPSNAFVIPQTPGHGHSIPTVPPQQIQSQATSQLPLQPSVHAVHHQVPPQPSMAQVSKATSQSLGSQSQPVGVANGGTVGKQQPVGGVHHALTNTVPDLVAPHGDAAAAGRVAQNVAGNTSTTSCQSLNAEPAVINQPGKTV